MQSVEESGRTVDDAVQAALKTLGVSRDEVDVEVLAEETRGILGILGHSEAKVRVTVRAGLAQRALDILTRVLDLMGIDARAQITAEEPEAVHIDIHSAEDLGLLIGKRGQTLASLQLLVAMMANRDQPPDKRRRIVLDAGGYRARRERAVTAAARNAAERAKRTGRQVTLDSLTPRERRIVHLTLANDPAVSTRSEGEDPHRSVIVAPRSGPRRS